MLFDLQGKRRRLIQATYLTLAILMGGGLVLFGIGSDVQGGLADIFTSGDSSSASPALEDQLEDAQERLEANPDDAEALADVARLNYSLATADPEARATGAIFAPDAQPRLEAAADAFERYLELEPDRPDDALAFSMIQVYGEQGLNQPEMAAQAAAIVAQERQSTQFYLLLAQYAAMAGDDRQAELAGRRAVELAPEAQRQQVERQVDALIEAAAAARSQPGAEGVPPGQAPPGGVPLPGGEGIVPPEGGPAPPDGAGGGTGSGGG